METPHVLVVHNEPAVRRLVADCLAHDPVHVSLAASAEEGLSLLESQRVQVLLTGVGVFGVGDAFVRRAATIQPLLGVVLIVDAARIDLALQSAQPGPVHYLPKPVTGDSLRSAVRRALEQQAKCRLAPRPREEVSPAGDGEAVSGAARIVAASKAMREILELVRRCAPTDACILISGEPDTGKELMARHIHRQSRRAAGPFVPIACGALREAELAERLFGYGDQGQDRGNRPPMTLLESAHGGTLFLEEVSQLPLWSQVRLLDALQQRQCFRAGSNERAALDVRVIASTTVDLHAAVAQHTFLSSMYYFLNIVQVHVPALRHRPQDVRPLAEIYLAFANYMRSRQGDAGPCHFGEDGFQCMQEYDWPGNTLQLASVVAHAVLLADGGEIGRKTITELLGEVNPRGDCDSISVPLAGGLKEIERSIIAAVIERCRGNKAAAARVLGMHRRTLYRILQEEVCAKRVEPAAKPTAMPLSFPYDPTLGGQSPVET
jgi:DNA-binding NtrC family response regulator